MPPNKPYLDSSRKLIFAGAEILAPLLQAHGFHFEPQAFGSSSGGGFSSGSFVRGNRRLELHFRYSLEPVTYWAAGRSLSQTEFIRARRSAGCESVPRILI